MRLIDADLLLEAIEKRADCEPTHFRVFKRIMKIVGEMPTEDTVKHGRWIPCTLKRHMGEMNGAKCSECGEEFIGLIESIRKYDIYCRHCGARMDLEE